MLRLTYRTVQMLFDRQVVLARNDGGSTTGSGGGC